jgi:hypothetical protein
VKKFWEFDPKDFATCMPFGNRQTASAYVKECCAELGNHDVGEVSDLGQLDGN